MLTGLIETIKGLLENFDFSAILEKITGFFG